MSSILLVSSNIMCHQNLCLHSGKWDFMSCCFFHSNMLIKGFQKAAPPKGKRVLEQKPSFVKCQLLHFVHFRQGQL